MAEQNKKKGLREFSISSFAVDNATSIFILALMVFLFGGMAYMRMPKEQFPEVEFPTVYINTPYFGNSAEDIENLVTRPIEKEIQSISGIKDIQSTSIQDFSVITAEFESGVDLDDAVRKVKDAVDKAKAELPNDLDQEPTVLDIDLSEIPILTINISGNYSNDELREYGELLEDRIEDEVSEISEVELRGALEREVKIDMDLLKMESMEVSFDDVRNAISSENITMSAGELVRNDFRRAIRIKGEFEEVSQLGEMIVKSENQRPVYLKDIAAIEFGFKDPTSIARADGNPVISLNVVKRSGENLLDAADKIKVLIEEIRQELPADISITLFNDQSVNTRTEVENLENSIISGVILVVLVLLFFLGIRNALFVGLAIPLSMLMGIMFLAISGITMNMVVLFSLILALGLLVDNAIVVVENVFRYMQEGYSRKEASKFGAGEVALPIIASTATTLAAFIPLAFWPGIMGSFMQYLPLTLILVLTSSLFVALVINTTFTSRLMKVDKRADEGSVRMRKRRNVVLGALLMLSLAAAFHFSAVVWARNILLIGGIVSLLNIFMLRPASFYFQNRLLPSLERGYDRFVRAALRIPFTVFVGTFVLLIAAIVLLVIRSPRVEFFPSAQPQYVNVFLDMPLGSDIEATDRMVRQLEEKVEEAIAPNREIVEAVLTQIGENTSDPNAPPEPGSSPHKARITVSFVPYQQRNGINTFAVMEKIRESVKVFPGIEVTVAKNADGPSAGKPINLEIQGDEIDELATVSEDVIRYLNLKNVPGIEELKADVKIGKPELIIQIDREAARRFGVSTFAIANAIRTSVYGAEVTKFKQGEDEYPIFIRLDERYRNNIGNLLNQKITFRNPANGRISQVPISSVADASFSSTYSSIKRKNLQRVITIYSEVVQGYNANEIIAQLNDLVSLYPFPEGFTWRFTGEQEQQAEDMAFLMTAFSVAIFAIFLIIVAQFNSIASPIIIALSILFSTIGVFLGYVFTGRTIAVVFTGVGIVSLAGVVVNNAIVLIDYIKLLIRRQLEKAGKEDVTELDPEAVREAVVQAGGTRLRPVLLTAITTVLGLVPLAVGFNFNFFTLITDSDPQVFIGGDNTAIWGPMAWTVIYGLVFATFLTLVVVPVMYWLAYRLQMFFKEKFFPAPSGIEAKL